MKIKTTINRLHKITERLKAVASEYLEKANKNIAVVSISNFYGPDQISELTKNHSESLSILNEYFLILDTIENIRKEIGKYNAKSGINDKMTAESIINIKIQAIKNIINVSAKDDVVPVKNLAEAWKNKIIKKEETLFSSRNNNSIDIILLTDEEKEKLNEQLNELKKIQYALSDDIAAINTNKIEIEIDDNIAKLIEKVSH